MNSEIFAFDDHLFIPEQNCCNNLPGVGRIEKIYILPENSKDITEMSLEEIQKQGYKAIPIYGESEIRCNIDTEFVLVDLPGIHTHNIDKHQYVNDAKGYFITPPREL